MWSQNLSSFSLSFPLKHSMLSPAGGVRGAWTDRHPKLGTPSNSVIPLLLIHSYSFTYDPFLGPSESH